MTREIKLDFLAGGKWSAASFSDVASQKTKLTVDKSALTRDTAISARMSPGGGFVMVIRPPH